MEQQICDPNTWPSRYYGRTRHVDIQKLYNELTSIDTPSSSSPTPRRSVSFSTAAPIIHEYEPEFDFLEDEDDTPPPAYEEPAIAYVPINDLECSTTVYAARRKKKSAALRKLDLRPVVNHQYSKNNNSNNNNNNKREIEDKEDDDYDKQSVASSECSLPITPPDIYPSSSLPHPSTTTTTTTTPPPAQPQCQQQIQTVEVDTKKMDGIVPRISSSSPSLLLRLRSTPWFNQRRKVL